ncbi:MAG: hypothetical protein IT371_30770 [Deltaproteobacteria bacterium]|nr:hypothetical protein [Deltaproteobacteria bacterium]
MARAKAAKAKPRARLDAVPMTIGPLVPFFWGEGRYMLWLAKSKASAEAMRRAATSPEGDFPVFLDRVGIGRGSLDLFMKHPLRKKHLLGGLMFRVLPDRLIVSHMVVDPKFRRRGINSLMIERIQKQFDGKPVYYYRPTKEGRAFMEARGGEESARNPGRDDAIKDAFRAWQGGDDAALERLKVERERAGLDPTPEHPEFKVMADGARGAGWNGKARMTTAQAEAAIMHELKRRGWHPDRQPSQVAFNIRVWISPDAQRRIVFNKKTVTWEIGGRGRWEKDYRIHTYLERESTVDAAARLMLKKAAKPITRAEWTTPLQNPPGDARGWDAERRALERAAMGGDAQAAWRLVEEVARRSPHGSHNAGLAVIVLKPLRVSGLRWPPFRRVIGLPNLVEKKPKKSRVTKWGWKVYYPTKYENGWEADSKTAALRSATNGIQSSVRQAWAPYPSATGFLTDRVLVIEDFAGYEALGTSNAYWHDVPGLSERSRLASASAEEIMRRMTPSDWTARMTEGG